MTGGKRVVIVGAGIAGLSCARLLSLSGFEVTVLERETTVGGLARSFCSDGFVFDIGPHRFHTDNSSVRAFIESVLGENLREFPRKSGVWISGRYYEWPLTAASIMTLPPRLLLKTGMDMLMPRRNLGGDGFDSYIINKYGPTLYEVFFKPYTQKFLGIPCAHISRDWAVTGLDRAVIDKGVRIDSLLSLTASLFQRRPSLLFLYPQTGGIQTFADRLVQLIAETGGQVLAGKRVAGISRNTDGSYDLLAEGERYSCDQLIWTAPLTSLFGFLDLDPPDLKYLPILIYNYRIRGKVPLEYQWCYYGAANIPFNRISNPTRFSPHMAPPGCESLCVEVTGGHNTYCHQQDMRIREALVSVGAVESLQDRIGVSMEYIPEAYPIYSLGYEQVYQEACKMIDGIANLSLLGRTGTFWYNNMDHSIEAALTLAQSMAGK